MSNTNNNLQTQTSNALTIHLEAEVKYRPPMLAPGNYVKWKSQIKRYIDTKPNNKLIYYYLQNPPYKFKWIEETVLVTEGSSETTTEGYIENYKNASHDIRNQLDAEAESIQIILTGIDNDIHSIVDACPNACEMWKAFEMFYKMINELVRNQCDVTNHQVNVQLLLQLQQEWQKFVTLVKQSQELKTVSCHKLYDILKQHHNKVNEVRAERLARKAIVNSPPPTYDQEPTMVAEDDEMSKEKEIDKLIALISLSFKKIYKPTNNNLRTSSNTSRVNQDNTLRINRGTGYDSQRAVNVVRARENVGTHVVQQFRIQCYNCKECGYVARECHKPKQAKDVSRCIQTRKKLMIQEVTLDAADNSGPIFDTKPLQNAQNDDDNYNMFANDKEHPKQPESINDTYLEEQSDTNITIDSLDMSTNGEIVDQDDDDLARELNKLNGEIEDFKTKNKSLESSNNHFKEANNELSKTNQLKFKDLKKFQAELDRYHDVNYASKVEINCAKAKEMKKELIAHQETISIMSQEKDAQKMFHKTREDKELEKVIALENKIKILDDIVYKTGQSVQTMNMLNRNCKTSFVKPELLKKAQRVNPHLYYIRCYNVNLALMLAPASDEMIHLAHESRSKLSTVKFGNDQIAPILGYGDLVQGNGNDLLTGSRGTDLYSITLQDTSTPNPICLMAKVTSSQSKPRAYRVYNKRTRLIVETIHVNFDELPQMALDHVSSYPVLQCPTTALEHDSLSPGPQSQENIPHTAETVTTSNELELLFSAMFDELLNGPTQVVSKSSVVNATNAPDKHQKQNTTPSNSTTIAVDKTPLNIQTTPETTSQTPTQAPTVNTN
ncbi:hypothetical protein Tco_0140439 [Tanacetum coccineum]